jgi:hypothetical protein
MALSAPGSRTRPWHRHRWLGRSGRTGIGGFEGHGPGPASVLHPGMPWEMMLYGCSKMTLSMRDPRGAVSRGATYLSAASQAQPAAIKPNRVSDSWACKMESQVADLKRRIAILKRLIADCDRLAADLNQEVQNEEDRVKIHDPAHCAYSIYARATASRRHNLRRSADELRAHLAKAEKTLFELGEAPVEV